MRHKSIGYVVLAAGLLLLVTPLQSLAVNSDVLTVYPNRTDGMNPNLPITEPANETTVENLITIPLPVGAPPVNPTNPGGQVPVYPLFLLLEPDGKTASDLIWSDGPSIFMCSDPAPAPACVLNSQSMNAINTVNGTPTQIKGIMNENANNSTTVLLGTFFNQANNTDITATSDFDVRVPWPRAVELMLLGMLVIGYFEWRGRTADT